MYDAPKSEETMISDAEGIYDFLLQNLGYERKNILLLGRSIGTGPAIHLASSREIGAIILVSAFTSLKAVVKDFAGSFAQMLIKER